MNTLPIIQNAKTLEHGYDDNVQLLREDVDFILNSYDLSALFRS